MFLGEKIENDFHDSKVIPLFLIGKHLGKNFKFHNNTTFDKKGAYVPV